MYYWGWKRSGNLEKSKLRREFGGEGGEKKPELRKWATEAAMCAGAAVKSAWSNRFCLSGTTTSESNWKSGEDLERELWIRRERERKKEQKSNTVWQSRRVFRSAFNKVNGDFSPQAPFYCKSLILACFISVNFHSSCFPLFSPSPCDCCTCCCSTSFLFFHANPCVFWLIILPSHQMQLFRIHPDQTAHFFRAPFLASVSWYNFHNTYTHTYIHTCTNW